MGLLDLNEDLSKYPERVPQGYFKKEKPPPGFFPALKWHISRHPRSYFFAVVGPLLCVGLLLMVFGGGSGEELAAVPMIPMSLLKELERKAEGYYHVSGSNSLYQTYGIPAAGTISVDVTFGERGKLRMAIRRETWNYDTGWIDYPTNQLIYVDGNVTALSGTVSGRVTLVVNGSTRITGSLRYVDADGDPACCLMDDSGPVAETGVDVAWGESRAATGLRYAANPNYNPSTPPPVLGLASRGNVEVVTTAGVNYNQEIHAAMLIVEGNFRCELDQRMGNLRTVGSMVARSHGWRYSGPDGAGYVLSGEHIDDRQVPPYFRSSDISTTGPSIRP
jgi:hypothetical protein